MYTQWKDSPINTSITSHMYLIYAVGLLTLKSANSNAAHAGTKLMKHMYFLHKAHRSLLALRTTRQHFSTILNRETTKKSIKIQKTWHQIGCKKDAYLPYESWNKAADYRLVWPLLGMCVEELRIFTAPQMSADDCKSVTSTDLGVTDKF